MQKIIQIFEGLVADGKKYLLGCLLLFFAIGLNAQTQTESFTTAGTTTWEVPSGVTKITVEAWGAGGKGGSTVKSNNTPCGGGGGGAYSNTILEVEPEQEYTVIVGNGSTNTDPGGDSRFYINTSNDIVRAKGGESLEDNLENGANGGDQSSGVGTTRISGKNGGDGTGTGSGVTGGKGGDGASGGSGGNGGTANNDGENGSSPGGGGGGAASQSQGTKSGGAGANGQIIITYSSFSLYSTSVSPTSICANNYVTVTLNSNLPAGNYTLTYTLSGNDAGVYTADITASSSGSASFDTNNLTGTTTITITNIENDSYGNDITANNTTNVTVIPTISITGPDEICVGETTQLTTSSGGNWVSNNTSVATVIERTGVVTAIAEGTATFTFTADYPECSATTPEITVLPTPDPVSVSGGDSHCGSTTLTATGGTGGTIYLQGTTSGGTSIANPSTSETITTSGTYYFRSLATNGCWGPEGSATVTINPLPVVSITGSDQICVGETTQLSSNANGGWVSNNTSVATVIERTGVVTAIAEGTATFTFTADYPECSATTPEITVLPTPDPVSVSGGGSHCGSTTLTATGSTGGTIYFQGTTSGGTSTANPNTSETITTSGTYYFRSLATNGCWGPEGSAEVIITEIPEISVDNNPSVCQNTTSANLDYTPTNGNPQGFNIYFDSDALSQGFYNQDGSLPGAGNPIVVQVPWSAPVGTYNATITVKTWSPVCTSPSYSFTITVNETVDNPGSITGSTSLCPGVSTATYSIDPVSGATSYTWNVPAGWSITSGQGTTEITVSTGTTGGTISVFAENDCGTSDNPSTLSVSTEDNEAPVVTCPASQTFDANYTGCTYQVPNDNSLDASATDNCVVASITHNYNGGGNSLNGESFPVGTTTVTWTASDGGGLESTCDFDITVVNPVSATVSRFSLNNECPELFKYQGFNANSENYDAGSTKIVFTVTLNSDPSSGWNFDYELTGANIRTGLSGAGIDPYYESSTGNIPVPAGNSSINLTFYVDNDPPVIVEPLLTIRNVSDGNCTNPSSTSESITIKAMPDVGDYE